MYQVPDKEERLQKQVEALTKERDELYWMLCTLIYRQGGEATFNASDLTEAPGNYIISTENSIVYNSLKVMVTVGPDYD